MNAIQDRLTASPQALAEAVDSRGPLEHLPAVLEDARVALDTAGIEHVVMGGIASSVLGRPRTTRDIDVFVRPADAERALVSFAARSFDVERLDPAWIYKAHKLGVSVDVIFATRGGLYFDAEMYARSRLASFRGVCVRVVSPEDLLIIKAVAHDEASPKHWWDALGVLMGTNIDWEYLIRRSRRAQRRVLSLLLYAQSLDYWVPGWVLRALMRRKSDGYYHATNNDQ